MLLNQANYFLNDTNNDVINNEYITKSYNQVLLILDKNIIKLNKIKNKINNIVKYINNNNGDDNGEDIITNLYDEIENLNINIKKILLILNSNDFQDLE